MKYLYTPEDIAVFLLASNFTRSDERAVIYDLWKHDNASIPAKYRENFQRFRREINLALSKYDGTLSDLDELHILMQDTEHTFHIDGSINEQGVVESYFKIMTLELTYLEGRNYRKIKLRNLLQRFGYQRRSPQLTKCMQTTLATLKLKTYLKGGVPCDIAEIDCDDMIMLRLGD